MRKTKRTHGAALIAATIVILAPSPSLAGGLNPNFTVPSFYGQSGTTYQEWYNDFTTATGSNAPGASNNPYGTAGLSDPTSSTDGNFLVSNDFYSFSGVINPQIVVPNAGLGSGYTTTIVFQFETYGQENPTLPTVVGQSATTTDVTLTGSDGTSALSATVELEASTSAQFGGFGLAYTNDYIVTWVVSGSASSYTIDYDAAVTSSAFTGARVDTDTLAVTPQAAPEPASIVSMSIGLIAALGWWGWRRRLHDSGHRHPSRMIALRA